MGPLSKIISTPSKLAVRQAIKAYHGSPHIFDRFKMSKVGTGEKAQAYGHGLYFGEHPLTAASYRNSLESNGPKNGPVRMARDVMDMFGGDRDLAVQELVGRLDDWRTTNPRYQKPGGDRLFSTAAETISRGDEFPGGKMYKVDIGGRPEDYLDWDTPISLSDPRAEAIDRLVVNAGRRRNISLRPPVESRALGRNMYKDLSDAMPTFNHYMSEREASKRLRDIGVPGIRFLDQNSRDPALLDLLREHGNPEGALSATTARLGELGPASDLSVLSPNVQALLGSMKRPNTGYVETPVRHLYEDVDKSAQDAVNNLKIFRPELGDDPAFLEAQKQAVKYARDNWERSVLENARNKLSKGSTHNYSVFDEDKIKIKDRYAHGGLAVKRGKR